MAGFDLASIMQSASTGASTFGALATQTLENTAAQSDITGIMADAAKAAQQAASSLEEGQQQVKQATQQTNLRIARTMGTDANDSGYLIGQMGQRVIESDKKASALLDDITAKRSVSFLDNPLGYLYAQATVDDDISSYNTEVRKGELAKDTATKLESMSQTAFQTQNAIEQSVTDASIKQSALLKGYAYGQAANEAQLAGLRTNLAGMTAAANATAQAIDLQFKGFGAVMQQKNFELNVEQLNLSKERLSAELEARKDKQETDGLAAKFISKGYEAMSGKVLEPARQKEMMQLYKAGQPEVRQMFNSGMSSYMLDPSGNRTVISTSAFDAATAVGTGLVQNLPQAQADVGSWLVDQRREFDKKIATGAIQVDIKDKSGAERAFNSFATQQAKLQGAIGQGIYAPTALATVAKTNPNMAALPVYAKVLAPMVAAGSNLDNPELVVGAVTQAIAKGTVSYEEALGLSTMYGAAVKINDAARNWTSFGLPPGSGYIAKLRDNTVFSKQVILTNQQDYARYLNTVLAQQAGMRDAAKFNGMN